MANERAVGIDLGTTNSAAACVNDSGRTEMIRNAEGDLLTPSVVLFGDTETVVGKEARNATTVHPDQVAEWVKRDMGSPVYSRPIRGEYLPPEVIQACILRKLKADVADALGPEGNVVITVPAYFDELRRKATVDAGEMAGLTVLDIVNEPTAAALAFGETAGYLTESGEAREEMTVLVYDLGGGTFDVTLLRLTPGDIRTLATDGDVQLGGHDWDMRLVNHVAEWFKQAHGPDPRSDPAALNRLYNGVVEAKHTLSARGQATIRVDYGGYSSEIQVGREEFKELTADLLERTSYTTRQLLTAAELKWKDVSHVLLVGGATRMPMVAGMLHQMSGITLDRTVNPDEAVARGAALYARHLLAQRAEGGPGPDFQVTNVNAHSLGVEGIDPETLRKINVVLIPRNTALPATFTETFTTKTAGQRSIVVQVLEGESSLPGECTAIGRTVVHDLPPDLPQGWPVEVTFEYATNGRLHVRTVVPGKDLEVTLEVEREAGLSNERVTQWKKTVSSSAGFDGFESMLDEVLGMSGSEYKETPPDEQAPSDQAGRDQEGADFEQPAADADAPASPTPQPTQTAPPQSQPLGQPPAATAGGQPATAGLPSRPLWSEAVQNIQSGRPQPSTRQIPHWLIFIVGYVTSAIFGLGIGYLLVNWLFPNSGLPQLW